MDSIFTLKRTAETLLELKKSGKTTEEITEYINFMKEKFHANITNIAIVLGTTTSDLREFLLKKYDAKEIKRRYELSGPTKEQKLILDEWRAYSMERKEREKSSKPGDPEFIYCDIEDIRPIPWEEIKSLELWKRGVYLEFMLRNYPANYIVYVDAFGVPTYQTLIDQLKLLRKEGFLPNDTTRPRKKINPDEFYAWLKRNNFKPLRETTFSETYPKKSNQKAPATTQKNEETRAPATTQKREENKEKVEINMSSQIAATSEDTSPAIVHIPAQSVKCPYLASCQLSYMVAIPLDLSKQDDLDFLSLINSDPKILDRTIKINV